MVDFDKIVDFVNNVYGENNVLLANLTLKEMGIDPATRRPTKRAADGLKSPRKTVIFTDGSKSSKVAGASRRR